MNQKKTSNRERRITGKARRIAAAGLAGCLLAGVSVQANAATLKDLFDEHYYADTYGDLKEAYGYDREALWQHFVTFGLSEGRNMNGLLDVVKYRQEYADLDEAFGDNWDAYVDHFLLYGAKENRDTGTDFNALDYAERYGDLKEAYGDDVLALWQHYQAYGAAEHREARDERILAAEKEAEEAAKKAAESQKPADSQTPGESDKPGEGQEPGDKPGESGGHTERKDYEDGSYEIYEYDERGKMVKSMFYTADGNLHFYTVYEYDAAGKLVKENNYLADGSSNGYVIPEYDVAGNKVKETFYNADGSYSIFEYDENGKAVKSTYYKADGTVDFVTEYSSDGKVIKDIWYNEEDGSISIILVPEYDSTGKVIKETGYDADGNVLGWNIPEYDNAGQVMKDVYYNADGSINYWLAFEYDSTGEIVKITMYNADGNEIVEQKPGEGVDPGEDMSHTERVDNPNGGWVIKEYNAAGNEIKRTCYNEDGSYNSIFEYDGTEKQLALKHSYYNLDSPGSLEATLEWEYNDNGIKVKVIETGYNPGDRVRFRHIVDYDEAGNEIKDVTYNADGSVMSDFGFTERSYYKNEAGYVPSESFTSNGKGGFSCYYEYDEAGNLIKQRIHNAAGTFTVREYDASGQAVRVTHYDADGNEIAG